MENSLQFSVEHHHVLNVFDFGGFTVIIYIYIINEAVIFLETLYFGSAEVLSPPPSGGEFLRL